MPFKSRAQVAKIAELEKTGKVKKGTVKKWLSETPKGGKGLPKRLTPKKKDPPPMSSLEEVRAYRKRKYGV